jgi:peptidyl-tRNA hydrolase, PTH1 family
LKYLITGLGNIGDEYKGTRHNIGFEILEAMAIASGISFLDKRYGFVAEYKFKGRVLVLLKPSTYVNLSGKAVNYWMQKENIPVENLLVLCDDLALPFGTTRLKPKGSDGGHNGLRNIQDVLGHQQYARLRFGIGSEFNPGSQVNFVLGKWDEHESKELPGRIEQSIEMIKGFATIGIARAMSQFNNK